MEEAGFCRGAGSCGPAGAGNTRNREHEAADTKPANSAERPPGQHEPGYCNAANPTGQDSRPAGPRKLPAKSRAGKNYCWSPPTITTLPQASGQSTLRIAALT